MQSYEYGKFGWILDVEGNKIELWEQLMLNFNKQLKKQIKNN
jgi:D-3-phosphoglycerate dehydrogenase